MARSMTFGVMPSKEEFIHAFHATSGTERGYHIKLVGEDLAAAERTNARNGFGVWNGNGVYYSLELYAFVKQLAARFNNKGDDSAGYLASAILGHLGFEWI